MGTLNKIPKTGTFGTAVDAMNDNFTLIEQLLAEGYSPYQVWLDQGNEGTEQDFLDSLKGEPGPPGTFIDPANVIIFSTPTAINEKTEAQRQSMLPDGNIIHAVNTDIYAKSTSPDYVPIATKAGAAYVTGALLSNGKLTANSSYKYISIPLADAGLSAGDILRVKTANSYTTTYALQFAFFQSETPIAIGDSFMVGSLSVFSAAKSTDYILKGYLTVPEGATHLVWSLYGNNNVSVLVQQVKEAAQIRDAHINGTYILDNKSFYDFYKKARTYLVGTTGQISSGTYGDSGVYYAMYTYIDVSNTKRLKYRLRNANAENMALLAAYDKDKNYLPEQSITRAGAGTLEGEWTRHESVKYIRLTVWWNNGNNSCYVYDPDLLKLRVDNMETGIDENTEGIKRIDNSVFGQLPILAKKANCCIDWNSAYDTNGSWRTYSDNPRYHTYIFDITALQGKKLAIHYWNRANVFSWAIVKDWEAIMTQTALVNNGWAENKVAGPSSKNSQMGKEYMATINIPTPTDTETYPDGYPKLHLLLVGMGDLIPSATAQGSLAYRVELLEGGEEKTGILDYNPKALFLPRLKNMVHRYQSSAGFATAPLMLAHFSDLHGNSSSLARLMEWCNEFNAYINDIVHTGDVVNSYYGNGMAWWDAVQGSENILNVIGNHDASTSSDGSGGKTQGECYAQYLQPYVANWGITQPEGVGDSESPDYQACYYYKDYADNHVRFIALDCMHRTTEQLNWLQATLADAAENSLTVVIGYHSHPKSSGYKLVPCPFTGHIIGSPGAYNWPAAFNAVDNFIAGTLPNQSTPGDFACWLCGHSHKDSVLWYGTQLSIAIDSMTTGNTGKNRIQDLTGKGQDLFNIVAVDTLRHTVKLLRVGSDVDDQLRHIDQCAFDYHTGLVLHEPEIPSVPAWSLLPDKPAYTPQEIGAIPATADISDIVKISQADYDALQTKSPTTLYVIVS